MAKRSVKKQQKRIEEVNSSKVVTEEEILEIIAKSECITERLKLYQFSSADYQRHTRPIKVSKIAKEFNEKLMGIIKVSCRDGKYYILDGLHRTAAMTVHYGNTDMSVQCQVYYGLSYEAEAYIFSSQNNNSTKLNAFEVYKGKYEMKDKKTLEMIKCIENAGLKWDFTARKREGCIICWDTIGKMYDKYGAEIITQALKLVNKTWLGDATSLDKTFLSGVIEFVAHSVIEDTNEKAIIEDDIFIKKLVKFTPDSLRAQSKMVRVTTMKDSINIRLAFIIMEIYNKNKKSNLLKLK